MESPCCASETNNTLNQLYFNNNKTCSLYAYFLQGNSTFFTCLDSDFHAKDVTCN